MKKQDHKVIICYKQLGCTDDYQAIADELRMDKQTVHIIMKEFIYSTDHLCDNICSSLYDDYYPQPSFEDKMELMRNTGCDRATADAAYGDAFNQWADKFILPLTSSGKWKLYITGSGRWYLVRK